MNVIITIPGLSADAGGPSEALQGLAPPLLMLDSASKSCQWMCRTAQPSSSSPSRIR